MDETHYLYRRTSPVTTFVMLGIAVALALLLPDAGWRLLAAWSALGPAVWLAGEALRRRRAVRLTDTHVIVEQPLLLFMRAVPYADITGVLTTATRAHSTLALAYRKPPRQPGLRPRLGLVTFDPIEGEAAFWETLLSRIPVDLPFSEAQVMGFLRARRIRRRMLVVAALLGIPFVVIILSRVAGPLLLK